MVRLTNLRGVNLRVFEFDYDLTWAALFLRADGLVYGRYGGRDADSPDSFHSLEGLAHSMKAALEQHARRERELPARAPAQRVEEYPAGQRLRPMACIHCHQAFEFRREARQQSGRWHQDELWVYPVPQNLGLSLDVKQGNRVRAVAADSPAAKAGLRAGDLLHEINGQPVASIADVQYALHRAAAEGWMPLQWSRAAESMRADLFAPKGWRVTDISWRPSSRGLEPPAGVHGEDLTADEKKGLGLPATRLAFRQGNFIPATARQAGIRQNDIILGMDGETLEMTAQQFRIWVALHRKVGDRITWNLLRNGTRLDLPMTLPARLPF